MFYDNGNPARHATLCNAGNYATQSFEYGVVV